MDWFQSIIFIYLLQSFNCESRIHQKSIADIQHSILDAFGFLLQRDLQNLTDLGIFGGRWTMYSNCASEQSIYVALWSLKNGMPHIPSTKRVSDSNRLLGEFSILNTSYKLLMAIVFTYRTWLSMSLFFRIAVSITGFKSPKLSSLVVSEGDRGIRAKYADSAYTCKITRTKKWMCLRWFKIHLFINSHAFSYLNPKNGEYDCKRSGEFHFIVSQRTDDMTTMIMFVTWYGLGLAICFSQHAEKRSHKRKIRRFALWHSNLKK